MAKIIFHNVADIAYEHAIGAGSTNQDIDYIIQDHNLISNFKSFDLTDAEYDGLFDGSKSYTISDNSITVIEHTMSDETVSEEEFKTQYDNYKQAIIDKIAKKTNHSKITEANACLTYLNSLDLSSLSYPHDNIYKKLQDNNKFVGMLAF